MSSLKNRLLVALLGLLLGAAAVFGLATYRSVLAETEALFDYQLRQMALSLRDQGEIAPDQAQALADEQLDFVVQIWTEDGRSIYASRLHPELPARALLGFADVQAGGQTWRTFGVATRARVIQVAQPRPVRQRLAAGTALRSVLPLLVVAPLFVLLGGWIVARTLAPLRRVATEVRGRDALALAPLPEAGLPDEVAPLVAALNGLLGRLGQALDAQRAFVADAAHELRSPLTALKLQLQMLRRAADEPARQAATEQLAQGIERAARLVEQLLALARSEPGAAAALESLDLAELARQALADLLPLAAARGSTLELQADAPVPLQGERAGLTALVRNLADNALRHSPPGGRVELRVGHEGGAAQLVVDDSGPGIPPAERDKVFDRFVRRAGQEEPGSGLGLAIVRAVAQRHGAEVTLGESPLGGLRVAVHWPLVPPSPAAPAPGRARVPAA
ncbi:ATP-binding protein [Piscinibacter defluvii]|uniref:ATP-binding protein n=1 Tax=Piscinibacter defluvii TaxID=1796922 RepID=UPI000FDEF5F3|nr:ATP-binding protein [Piscinibacter defluvii]